VTRIRKTGKFAGTSAYELITGEKIENWLSFLFEEEDPERIMQKNAA